MEGNRNLAEAKQKLLGVTIGKGTLMLGKVTRTLQRTNRKHFNALESNRNLAEAKQKLLGVTIGKGTFN